MPASDTTPSNVSANAESNMNTTDDMNKDESHSDLSRFANDPNEPGSVASVSAAAEETNVENMTEYDRTYRSARGTLISLRGFPSSSFDVSKLSSEAKDITGFLQVASSLEDPCPSVEELENRASRCARLSYADKTKWVGMMDEEYNILYPAFERFGIGENTSTRVSSVVAASEDSESRRKGA